MVILSSEMENEAEWDEAQVWNPTYTSRNAAQLGGGDLSHRELCISFSQGSTPWALQANQWTEGRGQKLNPQTIPEAVLTAHSFYADE